MGGILAPEWGCGEESSQKLAPLIDLRGAAEVKVWSLLVQGPMSRGLLKPDHRTTSQASGGQGREGSPGYSWLVTAQGQEPQAGDEDSMDLAGVLALPVSATVILHFPL